MTKAFEKLVDSLMIRTVDGGSGCWCKYSGQLIGVWREDSTPGAHNLVPRLSRYWKARYLKAIHHKLGV